MTIRGLDLPSSWVKQVQRVDHHTDTIAAVILSDGMDKKGGQPGLGIRTSMLPQETKVGDET